MAVTLNVVAALDETQAATLAAQVRAVTRQAVHDGIRAALGDLAASAPLGAPLQSSG